jgi:hypothetical protein
MLIKSSTDVCRHPPVLTARGWKTGTVILGQTTALGYRPPTWEGIIPIIGPWPLTVREDQFDEPARRCTHICDCGRNPGRNVEALVHSVS